jgi:soluble lytic murein transglycosylase-like protein
MRHEELRLRPGAPRKVSPIRAGRARVAWLVLLCALLVSGGAPPSEPDAAAAQSIGTAVFTQARVSQVLYRLNPGLGALQRERIAAAVVRYSVKYELDPALVLAVISRESTARPWVRSAKGALGLMQVMPYMQGSLLVAGNLTHVESNIEAGCMILADNIRRLGEGRGISAYFWGNDVRDGRYLEAVEAARARIRREAATSQAG